jgi:CelD/BcsL family acetyltransferase involved in cellulose biosynthesis
MEPLSIEEVNSIEGFRALKETWHALLVQSPDNNIFLTWEWLFNWWRYYGAGNKLRLFLIKERDRVIGIAPFMQSKYRVGFVTVKILENLCSVNCDYGGIILAERIRESVVALFNYIQKTLKKDRTLLHMAEVPEGSAFITALRETYPEFADTLYFEEQPAGCCPYIQLPATWDEYLAMLSQNRRRSIRRMIKLLKEQNHEVGFYKYNGGDLKDKLQVLFDIHEKRWNEKHIGSKFSEHQTREFYLEVSRDFYENKWLDLSVLDIDGKPASVLWGFNYNDVFLGMTIAFDSQYSQFSAGQLHFMKLIEAAIQNHQKKFDFLKGDEEYKSHWAHDMIRNVQITVARKGIIGKCRVIYSELIIKCSNILKIGIRQYLKELKDTSERRSINKTGTGDNGQKHRNQVESSINDF